MRKVRWLCRGCNQSVLRAAYGRDSEGFLLVTWSVAEIGGETWMRSVMLNKRRWKKWRRALRETDRKGGFGGVVEEGTGGNRAARIPVALSVMPQLILSRESWEEWCERELRGSREHSLLQEFYEEEAWAHRSRWHRWELGCMFVRWTYKLD